MGGELDKLPRSTRFNVRNLTEDSCMFSYDADFELGCSAKVLLLAYNQLKGTNIKLPCSEDELKVKYLFQEPDTKDRNLSVEDSEVIPGDKVLPCTITGAVPKPLSGIQVDDNEMVCTFIRKDKSGKKIQNK